MEEKQKVNQPEKKSVFTFSTSTKIIIVLLITIALILSIFYLFYKNGQEKQQQYEKGITNLNILHSEQDRCLNLLGSQNGNFKDYDYCQKLIQKFSK